jgi:transglutaminase-like putative cysteine protease
MMSCSRRWIVALSIAASPIFAARAPASHDPIALCGKATFEQAVPAAIGVNLGEFSKPWAGWRGKLVAPSTVTGAEKPLRSRTFELTYQATVIKAPNSAKALELWLPVPVTDRNQTIHRITLNAPGPVTIGREPRFGNQCLYVRAQPTGGSLSVSLTVEATRVENAGSAEILKADDRARYLAPEPLVPLTGPVHDLAESATRGLSTDAEKARAIYDKVTGMMKYDKSGTGWGRGDALFACDAKRGNCTDFHALIIGMARSVGVPARFAMGLSLPPAVGKGEITGYHCWAELYVDGRGWVPVDGSEAAKDPAKRDYFFGRHDANRLEFSRGRHLTLAPKQHGSRLNFFIYPYAEVDGAPHEAIDRKITYVDLERPSSDLVQRP